MSIQNHNSPNMQMFRSSQFHNCVSQNHKIANMPIITVISTTMSQNHEITKLHIFEVIVGTTMIRSNCKFRSLMVFSPTMSMHQIAPYRLQRCLRITKTATSTATMDKFISHQMSIAVQNIRTPFRDEWLWINPRQNRCTSSSRLSLYICTPSPSSCSK